MSWGWISTWVVEVGMVYAKFAFFLHRQIWICCIHTYKDDISGYDLPTIDFVQTPKDNDEDVSILEEDNPQIYAHLSNVLVHMIDKQEAAIFKSKQDFN